MLNGLDLFSGYGGIGRALRPWVRTVAYCEIEQYCHGILVSEMSRGRIDRAPIWDDVRTLRREHISAPIDIISGGFPCQDVSVAGNGKGLDGERSGLFFEVVRLACEFRPRFLFLENVPGLIVRGIDRVAAELAANGYVGRYGVLSAYDVGAPHLRERVWIAAYADSERCRQGSNRLTFSNGSSLADAGSKGLSLAGIEGGIRAQNGSGTSAGAERGSGSPRRTDWWATEPGVGRVVDGFTYRCDRIRALGNGVVPQTAEEAFKRLLGIERGWK